MEPPDTARFLLKRAPGAKYLAVDHRASHLAAAKQAREWTDLEPLRAQRSHLQPNTNLLRGLRAADGYNGLAPVHSLVAWDDMGHGGKLQELKVGSAAWVRFLQLNGVAHVVTQGPLPSRKLQEVFAGEGGYLVHAVPQPVRAAHLASQAVAAEGPVEAWQAMLTQSFQPGRDVALLGTDAAEACMHVAYTAEEGVAAGEALIESRDGSRVVVMTRAARPSILVLTDTYSPQWTASVDGTPAPVWMANGHHRGVPAPAGEHRGTFDLVWRSVRMATWVGCACSFCSP